MMTKAKIRNSVLGGFAAAWLALMVYGSVLVFNYEATPGVSAAAISEEWPSKSTLTRSELSHTLVMAVHPKCPCTRASVRELKRVIDGVQRPVKVYVVFVKPEGSDNSWDDTEIWNSVAGIPGVIAISDEGFEANLFDAATSGQTFVYDPMGKLVFRGGITQGRGHEGVNAGGNAILSLLNAGTSDVSETQVYGCPLFAANECKKEVPDHNDQR